MKSCLICKKEIEEFELYGVPERRGRCPNCGSKGRGRTLLYFLENNFAPGAGEGSRVLEVGPTKVSIRHLLQERFIGKAVFDGIDIRELKLHGEVKPPHKMTYMSVNEMSFGDAIFDLILCNNVLQFIPDYKTALEEIRRCLKPTGLAILNVERIREKTISADQYRIENPDATEEYIEENGSQWFFGQDYLDFLKKAGFKSVEIVCPFKESSDEFLEKHGVRRDKPLIVARPKSTPFG